MKIERKTFNSAGFKAVDAAQGIAEMIVSVFNNVDGGNERVLPGAFGESLAARRTADGRPRIKGVFGHDWSTPIAKTLDAQELLPGDPRLPESLNALGGLWVKAQFNLETQRGREAFSDIQFGSVDEFSIGYKTLLDKWSNGVRDLVKVELFEWSPVLVGMNDATALINTKSAADYMPEIKGDTARDFNTVRRAAQVEQDLSEHRWEIEDALRESVGSILEDETLDSPTKLTMLRTSVAQYGDALAAWAQQSLILQAAGSDVHFDGLDSGETKGQPLTDQVKVALAATEAVVVRYKALAAELVKVGRAISQTRLERMAAVRDQMRQMADEMDALMTEANPKKALSTDYLELRLRASAFALAHLN